MMFVVQILALIAVVIAAPDKKNKTNVVTLEGGYIYQPLEGTNTTAGYGLIKNTSQKSVQVAVVSAQGFKAVELHQTIEKDGMMKMEKMDSVTLGQGESFELKPKGNHIMLFDPTQKFKEGDKVEVVFKVGEQNRVLVFKIQSRASESHNHHHSHH